MQERSEVMPQGTLRAKAKAHLRSHCFLRLQAACELRLGGQEGITLLGFNEAV